MNENKIYLCDLTHDGLVLSSSIFPLSIGLISAYLKEKRGSHIDVELFKYPHEFSDALQKHPPKIVGFANYSWITLYLELLPNKLNYCGLKQ